MNLAPIVKLVRAYDATEWEIFISEWQKGLTGYASVKRLGGSGDQGRDVIGLCTSTGCQGVWDIQRAELGVSPGYDSSTIIAQQQLDGATLDQFSQVVEAELQSWQFPDAQRVFFELSKMDISVSGKARAANGKGVRALLHGAFSIALMKFCRDRRRAHPGFLILDSLFITYRDPSDAGDSAIASTPLKDRAFKAFGAIPSNLQLIILENVDVPAWLEGQPQVTHFTGNAAAGRAGLFPKITDR